jgi:hypothetical protein
MTELTKPYIVAFDIGKKNFAFVVEEIINKDIFTTLPEIKKKDRYHKTGDKDIIGTPTKEFSNLLEKIYNTSKVVMVKNHDITSGTVKSTILEEKIFLNMYDVLDQYIDIWNNCEAILIEKQMSFGTGKQNTMAMKLAQHCYSYFIYHYRGSKHPIEFPAYLKTQLLGAPKHFGTITKTFKNGKTTEVKDNRKRWAARKAIEILTNRNDTNTLDAIETKHARKQQQDDMSDCLLMCEAYCLAQYYDGQTFT